jgi:hypothetical protein
MYYEGRIPLDTLLLGMPKLKVVMSILYCVYVLYTVHFVS